MPIAALGLTPRGNLASVFHKHAETAAHNWPLWLCEYTSKSLFFSRRKTGGVKWEEMKLLTVLVISICSSSLTYSSGRQLALGNAASSFAKTKQNKKNLWRHQMLSPGLLHSFSHRLSIMNLNSLGDCDTEKDLMYLVNISFKKKEERKKVQVDSVGESGLAGLCDLFYTVHSLCK